MGINWILPTNFMTNTFSYGSRAITASNPFGGSIFPMVSPMSLPTYFPMPSFSSFIPNFFKNLFNFGNAGHYRSQGVSVSGANQNMSFWKRLGYCAQKGLTLAQEAVRGIVGFVGKCAKFVKNAISRSGLGRYVNGNACDMVGIMRKNKNFREISASGVNLKNLPAGCVLVYGRGAAGYSGKYGHVEITTGTGKAVSDGVTNNLHRQPTAIFMPIAA